MVNSLRQLRVLCAFCVKLKYKNAEFAKIAQSAQSGNLIASFSRFLYFFC